MSNLLTASLTDGNANLITGHTMKWRSPLIPTHTVYSLYLSLCELFFGCPGYLLSHLLHIHIHIPLSILSSVAATKLSKLAQKLPPAEVTEANFLLATEQALLPPPCPAHKRYVLDVIVVVGVVIVVVIIIASGTQQPLFRHALKLQHFSLQHSN